MRKNPRYGCKVVVEKNQTVELQLFDFYHGLKK